MKTPGSLGLPPKFKTWRRGQERTIRKLAYSDRTFNLLCSPTGSGKTATAMAIAALDEDRVGYLTATRHLANQVNEDFESMGLVDMRGRNNYICDIDESKTAAEAVCTGGVYCALMKQGGCGYYDQQKMAKASRLVITNYRYWLHAEESGSIGTFPILVCDEAHKTPDEISDFAAVEITIGELKGFGLEAPPRAGRGKPAYWAQQGIHSLETLATQTGNVERRRKLKTLQRKLARLCKLSDQDWLASSPKAGVWRWDLINPGALAKDLLFRGARKVILVSASLRRKHLQLLGVDEKVQVMEQESTFSVKRRPIYYWPVVSMGRFASSRDIARWHEAHRTIIEPRMDRNGVIHSHSFDRAWEIFRGLSYEQQRMSIVHKKGEDASDVFLAFVARGSRKPTILISPSVSTGVDFKYGIAEWQIIPKMPFPDFRSPLIKARLKLDRDYASFITMQTLVQTAGRPMRAEDDQGETFITDGNFSWLRGSHWDFAPEYFHNAVRTISKEALPPPPPPKLDLRLLTGS